LGYRAPAPRAARSGPQGVPARIPRGGESRLFVSHAAGGLAAAFRSSAAGGSDASANLLERSSRLAYDVMARPRVAVKPGKAERMQRRSPPRGPRLARACQLDRPRLGQRIGRLRGRPRRTSTRADTRPARRSARVATPSLLPCCHLWPFASGRNPLLARDLLSAPERIRTSDLRFRRRAPLGPVVERNPGRCAATGAATIFRRGGAWRVETGSTESAGSPGRPSVP
jgi:hypothetical protein